MKLPRELGVMTLPGVTLFPHALLPLYIFEPRYRRMLADALEGDRVFCVAMQKPNCTREAPETIAGLGLIRVSVQHDDGTSHLILQGLMRVELRETVKYRPYRRQLFRALPPESGGDLKVDALVLKVRELIAQRLDLGLPLAPPLGPLGKPAAGCCQGTALVAKEILNYVNELANPEHVADLVSCALLHKPEQRQAILSTVNVADRLRRLVRFLQAEILRRSQANENEH